jgi:hypothetical protein
MSSSSTFTWLDYSEHERRKMLDVIDLFGEKTTRDELGLGGVRDAFADLLFPGTTTIQTVAKYFLFVPWMYMDLERKQVQSNKVAERARKFEIDLAKTLGDADGVIGKRAKDSLKRLPSSVYWQGLMAWGIRVYPKSQSEYHKSLDLHYVRMKGRDATATEFDGEGVHGSALANWHPSIVQPPDDFPGVASMELTLEEASYLRERIMTNCADSLLAYLLKSNVDVRGVPFAWDLETPLPESLSNPLGHARNFSEVMHGAQLLYNLILAEQSNNDDRQDEYRERMNDWWVIIAQGNARFADWNLKQFWAIVFKVNPRISARAKQFIELWIATVQSATSLDGVVDNTSARDLISQREHQIKGSLARTRNERARDLWSGAAGSEQLDLRWRTSRRIISDILLLGVGTDAPAN